MSKLNAKIALITGGTTGLGFAAAHRFQSEGAEVIITGRRQAELDFAVKRLGGNVLGVQGDVSNLKDLDRLYATIRKQKGHLDILFANAGGGSLLRWARSRRNISIRSLTSTLKDCFLPSRKRFPC